MTSPPTASLVSAVEGKERPIIMGAPSVRAILAGRKTQTRRLFKPRGFTFYEHPVSGPRFDEHSKSRGLVGSGPMYPDALRPYFPYQAGDRLWVREAVQAEDCPDTWDHGVRYLADDAWVKVADHEDVETDALGRWWLLNTYRSDDPDLTGGQKVPPIHMPRWASRITLEVTEVRVERLHDISCADAIAEGIAPVANSETIDCDTPDPREDYRSLWSIIHGKDAWDANPWVCAIAFRRIPDVAGKQEGRT